MKMAWDEYYDLGESIMKRSRIVKGKPQRRDVTPYGEKVLLASRQKNIHKTHKRK